MATSTHITHTEETISRSSHNGVTVRVVWRSNQTFPFAVLLTTPQTGRKPSQIDAYCLLPDAMRRATEEFNIAIAQF